ncbi:MAG: hypothetical protein NT091_02350 [Candidatus Falkowbacteria bacterium]|nr:hypothetical protein [Candidatus Falkowbacteria bacterium]
MKINKRIIKYTLIPSILLITIWFSPFIIQRFKNREWVEMNPIKCLGNSWEFDWLMSHSGQYANYPKETSEKISLAEINILKNFFKKNNIELTDVKSVALKDQANSTIKLCETCNCPQGYTLYAQIKKESLKNMLELGWKKSNIHF